ncbi:substrate-binding domain-containing protein [Mesorhizobium sp. B2-7-1]|uniref:substrate-binding domain-containing protein n=1 Tax=Mesorhizobium sp. B2-7-1 TaxID=2589909 RepID=UPI001128C326|nr:substrate-binding domain-containing protein [Mesorhizobium sp. B2-7-1]TPJ61053.1 sugar ABC transporter substrate-binding protein [Mesorhizobium sp. B2-7-1]
MGSMLKSTLIALGMTALASAVTAPARAQESSFGPADAKETYYWISNKANLPLFVQYDYVGMKKIAEELGVKATGGRQVAVVGGWDPSLTESVKKCIEQGVPTVVDDGDLPASGRLAYIGTNWTQVGVAQAKKMMEKVPNGGKLAMMSIINAGNMREAVAGFKAYIEANGGGKYNIVSNEDDGGDAQKAAQVTAAILAANPDIAGIAGFDSESGAGIVTALREAGKNPGDIKVTAMEQTPDFFKTAKEGWVDGIVVQNRELFIYYAVKILHDYNHNGLKSAGLAAADGGRPVPDTLDTGVLLVTKDNVDKVTAALGVK